MISSKCIRLQLLLSTAAAASLALPGGAVAAPLPVPAAPNPNITTNGNTETVTLTNPRTAINWNSFDIDQNFTVNFTGPNNAAVLNRVVTADVSNINGTLLSDPTIDVFLINPNGIIFGSGAVVNVGSFIASTLELTDAEFLAGGTADPGDPTLKYHFSGIPGDPSAQVSTGVTVQNGAHINTATGPITLLGGLIDVQTGGVVNAATDVGLLGGNAVTVPADPGSRISFWIGRQTPVANAIKVGGAVTGRNVIGFMETADDAQDALLSISNTGSIKATNAGGGNIVLSLVAQTGDGGYTDSPGGVINDGNLTAAGAIVVAGASIPQNNSEFGIAFIENNGTMNAGGNVFLQAQHEILNAGKITADNVTLSAIASGTDFSGSGVQVTNSGKIVADGDVRLFASHVGSPSFSSSALEAKPLAAASHEVSVTNSGSITAGGNVTLEAFATDASVSHVEVVNDGTIDAGGDVNLFAAISLSTSASGTATAPLSAQVTNSGSITAGRDVNLRAIIDAVATVSDSGFSSAAGSASARVLNSGSISAGRDVKLDARISAVAIPSSFASGSVAAASANAVVQVTNSGSIDAGRNVSLSGKISLAASSVNFDSPLNADVEVTNSGSIAAGGDVAVLGQIEASGLDAIVNADVHLANSGSMSAGGDVLFSAEVFGSAPAPNVDIVNDGKIIARGNVLFFANTGDITNSGVISASGDVSLFADNGDITNIGSISAAGSFTAEASNGNIINSGTIDGGGNAFLNADGNIINSGVIDAGGVADLEAGNDIDNSGSVVAGGNAILNAGHDIDNTGAVSAGGDAIFTAVNDILDSSGTFAGTISGADVALSAGGSITAGSVTARDDIAIRAGGAVTAGSLISGATINGQGPVDVAGAADELLPGVDLSGHDIDVDGTAIAVDIVHALGAGSDIRLRKPVTSSREDLDFFAGGDITIDGSASAVDVAMDAGGTINAGDISARDDIALRAGNTLNVGILQSGVTIAGAGPVDQNGSADALLGQNLAGHDLFVQGGTVDLSTAIANGTGSDLTVRATTGGLTIADGEAGGTITLVKQGATGILTGGTLLAGTGASLTSDTDIDAQTVQTLSGDLAFDAGRDATVHSSLIGDDVAIKAGRNITTGDISARDDIAIIAGGTLSTGTLASGVAIGGRGPLDSAGAADALLAGQDLTGHDLYVQAGSVSLASATANGAGSDLTARATTGNLTIQNGVAGGNVNLDAALLATVGTVTAQAGNVNILADDLDILTSISGQQVSITNRDGGNDVTVLGDAGAASAFTLTQDEINRIHTATLTIDSLGQNLLVGNVAFANDVGSSRINLLGTGRVDIVGAIDGSGVTRTLQIGGTLDPGDPNNPATLASIIRIAATSSAGGRIILGDGTLDLRGVKIGVGLDDGFLQPLGLTEGGTPASTDVVQADWIGNPKSALYGVPGGYANPFVISAGTINVTYADYALFQNTGSRSKPNGVNAGVLNIFSSGADGNGFEMFGTIDQVGGIGAAFLVNPTEVSLGNSRINGCLILTGGGCLDQIGGGGGGGTNGVTIFDPTNQQVDEQGDPSSGAGGVFGQQDLISSGDDNVFDFDSLVGTNNEGLLGVLGVDDACAPDDKRDTCRVKEKANEQ